MPQNRYLGIFLEISHRLVSPFLLSFFYWDDQSNPCELRVWFIFLATPATIKLNWNWSKHGVINKTSDLMRLTYPLPSILIAFTSQSQKPILNQNLKSPKANQEKSRVTLHKSCKRKVPHMSNENQSKGKVRKLDNIMDVFFSPEKRLKLSLALNEINRRLAGQILIWKMLPCETG